MRRFEKSLFVSLMILALGMSAIAQHRHSDASVGSSETKPGVLLLAHGGKPAWNEEVRKVAAEVEKIAPVEIAFGMASKATIQTAVDALVKRGVTKIIAVPLFISSNSSVITSTQYLLGQRQDAPTELATFASMDHGNSHSTSHASHSGSMQMDPLTPIASAVPITMLSALDSHPLVADILLARAKALSSSPNKEVVVIVAHGPVSNETNDLWLKDMSRLAELMRKNSSFKQIEYLTVRDDAPDPIRSQATAEFRSIVSSATSQNKKVLIVPLLLSFGGIEEGVKKRLDGLEFSMSSQALLPDPRISKWVIESVQKSKK